MPGRDRESAAGGGCGWEETGRHGGCAAQSGGVAAERGCGVEDGFQGEAKDAGRCGVGSGDGLEKLMKVIGF